MRSVPRPLHALHSHGTRVRVDLSWGSTQRPWGPESGCQRLSTWRPFIFKVLNAFLDLGFPGSKARECSGLKSQSHGQSTVSLGNPFIPSFKHHGIASFFASPTSSTRIAHMPDPTKPRLRMVCIRSCDCWSVGWGGSYTWPQKAKGAKKRQKKGK